MRLLRVSRLIAISALLVGLPGLLSASVLRVAAQGTGGGAVITVTVTSHDGAPMPGAIVTAIDADSTPTSQGPETTDLAGQVMLFNFVVGDQVTISAQPPVDVLVAGASTTIAVNETPTSVMLALGAPPTVPTPTPVPALSPTSPPALPPTSAPAPGSADALTGMTVRTVDPDGALMTGAGYTVYLPDSSALLAMDEDDGASDGVTSFAGLPIGAAVAVSQTSPPGNTASASNQTFVLTSFSGANVLTFTNQPLAVPTETPVPSLSQVSIRALLCESADLTGKTEYTLGMDVIAPESCPAADDVRFSFSTATDDQAVEAAALSETTTDIAGTASLTLPAGTYTVGNELAGGTMTLEVDGVSVYRLTAVIYLSAGLETPTATPPANALTPPARLTGDAQITVMVCTNPAQSGSVEFQVGQPGASLDVTGAIARVSAAMPDGCTPSAAALTISPFSDPSAAAVLVSVDATGFVVLDDLASTVDREPHLLTAVATGGTYEAPFEIAPGAMTEIVARVFLGGDVAPPAAGTPDTIEETPEETPAVPATATAVRDGTGGYAPGGGSRPGGGGRVTHLPNTGSGSPSTTPLLLIVVSGLGLVALRAWRHAAPNR